MTFKRKENREMIRWIMFLIGVFGMVLGIGGAVNDDIWVLMIGFFLLGMWMMFVTPKE